MITVAVTISRNLTVKNFVDSFIFFQTGGSLDPPVFADRTTEAENVEEVQKLSHILKGSSALIGAKPLFKAARELNLIAKQNSLENFSIEEILYQPESKPKYKL